AAETPLPNEQLQGSIGAGTGCTVGKLRGMEYAVKGGIGIAAREYGGLQVGAVVAVNAIGDVCGPDGTPMAGLLADDKKALLNSVYYLLEQGIPQGAPNSTTLCAVATNARLDKTQCARVAALAYHGITRAVRPAGLSMDGDTVYALSCGDFTANADIVGTLAAEAVFEAIQNSIVNCTLSIVN
ncbi:MAG: P1 family peptidase, partial [Clostridia bacterium]|nr:P1 family peptidase [Clostridia bacterium]